MSVCHVFAGDLVSRHFAFVTVEADCSILRSFNCIQVTHYI